MEAAKMLLVGGHADDVSAMAAHREAEIRLKVLQHFAKEQPEAVKEFIRKLTIMSLSVVGRFLIMAFFRGFHSLAFWHLPSNWERCRFYKLLI